jgi:hypothetical protein
MLVGEEDTSEAVEDSEAGAGDWPEAPTTDTLVATTETVVQYIVFFSLSFFAIFNHQFVLL